MLMLKYQALVICKTTKPDKRVSNHNQNQNIRYLVCEMYQNPYFSRIIQNLHNGKSSGQKPTLLYFGGYFLKCHGILEVKLLVLRLSNQEQYHPVSSCLKK